MTPDQLPPSATVDVGLIGFAVLVTLLFAALASVVVAARHERRKADRLTAAQVDRSVRIAEARRRPDPLPWPLEHRHWEDLTADAEGEALGAEASR